MESCWASAMKKSEVIVKIAAYLDLKEVLRLAIDLLEALLARIWHGLHCNGSIGALRATLTYVW